MAPVIDITDLYHPHQDPGDNFDILAPYCLPEIDLRAVILDATERFRRPWFDHPYWGRLYGPREPGYVPMTQLNYLFGRNVPFAAGPFASMESPGDRMEHLTAFQAAGVDLILQTLRESEPGIEILCFGSVRALAVAFNREPALFHAKVGRVHLSAGSSSPDFIEWNVELDPHAMACVLRSGLPLALYPCATEDGPLAYGRHNTYWKLTDLRFIAGMQPQLRRYLAYVFERMERNDFLAAMESDFPADVMERVCARAHNVWETAIWARVAGRALVRRADGTHRLIPAGEVTAGDTLLPERLLPCRIDVRPGGVFDFTLTDQPTTCAIFERGDPLENERALREALPALYQGFNTGAASRSRIHARSRRATMMP
jgi:hypothetical protein